MKQSDIKEKIYNRYQLLKETVKADGPRGGESREYRGLDGQIQLPRETRKTIKWRSKGY